MSRVLGNGPWIRVQSQVESTKKKKMVLYAALPNTQYYKVKLNNPGKGVVAIEKGAFGLPSAKVADFYLFLFSSSVVQPSLFDRFNLFMYMLYRPYSMIGQLPSPHFSFFLFVSFWLPSVTLSVASFELSCLFCIPCL